ncbi:hypothetical protein [Pseudomonas rhizophila]|uniref:hypothetical protein n=1 Tax=Pseudomonas rhizophila TaxID=2045200 RepID=UPI0030DB0DCC
MHYEKKEFNKLSLQTAIQNSMLFLSTILIAILLLYIHAPSEFWWPIKFIDIINVIAQIATAAAFFLAIHQYRKNKESERQKVLIEESRALINKMKTEAEAFSNIQHPNLESAINFMEKITSHAGNFDAIFKVLNEDIHKAIVRMHWQDMYFIELNKAVQYFNSSMSLVDFNVLPTTYLKALAQFSYAQLKGENPSPIFVDYLKLQFIANLESVKCELKIDNEHHLTIYLFEKCLFDNNDLNDHLFGCLNRIDIRVRSPLIAVINEKHHLQGQARDPNTFKMFWSLPIESQSDALQQQG